ncbi:MAG: hypothetical protein XD92_0435 [Proteiniphilum acetatigenes]|uniref:SPOR domain-containing protein n=1 Tax=Proteiniphilum acetatigenes TaxID=294710 RepID=A0A101HKM3_9BACT|nr:MAG: hypothetical protein XD92_0435 [Proteiniphilum acetatigenes]
MKVFNQMNELVSHIEFLLHDHNCVIIPGFGGFVVNTSPARRDGISTFFPPSCELVFNRDLTHNDGLLAQSYMKSEEIPFEAAMTKIELAVEELKRRLRDDRQVVLGDLGQFIMNDDKRFVYKPSHFVQPVFFGLSKAALKPLIQMQSHAVKVSPKEERQPRYRSIGIAAAAASILLLMMFLLPVGDRTIVRQSAQILSETDLFGSPFQRNITGGNVSEGVVAEVAVVSTTENIQPELAAQTPVAVAAADEDQPRYYIIVGVYKVKEVAEKMMANLLENGFSDRGWMIRPGRIDVYALSFADREDAQSTLRKIHKEYPDYRDAWILKR